MIPLQPVSVKFTDEERAKLKALASALGWTESKVIRDSVDAITRYVLNPPMTSEPKIVFMARQALQHEGNDSLLKDYLNRLHLHIAEKPSIG